MKNVSVIGAGFSGLSAASFLAKQGFDVTVYEKHLLPGGRARKFEHDGFTFDMGPSWYWMPDVFEKYFNQFGKTASDYYDLVRLNPSYRVFYGKGDFMDVPAGLDALSVLFEKLETGSSRNLKKFLNEARYKYEIGINQLVYKPGLSITELLDKSLVLGLFKLHVFNSLASHVRRYFKEPRIIQLLEFPVLFLGAPPQKIPALYSLMNYADMALGTWYPMGGMYKIIEGMTNLAEELGVKFKTASAVNRIEMKSGKANGLWVNGSLHLTDYIVAGADYHHVEQHLLPEHVRQYSPKYWDQRVLAPSSLIFYLGVKKQVKNLLHHNLFFDEDFSLHAREIYDDPKWPTAPQFYVSCTSKTDPTVAPPGYENLFILIPVAPGIEENESIREKYFNIIMNRLEHLTGDSIRQNIIFKKSYAHNDFKNDYNAFKGNAYGLANTLMQTANLKPGIINKKVPNLFYTGQLTVPGPGVPPSLISGRVTAETLIKTHQKNQNHKTHETVIR